MDDNQNQSETSYEKESQELDNIENAQSAQQATPALQDPAQQNPQQPPQKPHENFNLGEELGKMMETASSSLFGSTDPAQMAADAQEKAKKENEDKVKAANIKNFLDQMAQDEARLRAQRQEEAQKKQEDTQEEAEEKQKEEMEKQKKDQSFEQQIIQAEQTKAERKLGVGG